VPLLLDLILIHGDPRMELRLSSLDLGVCLRARFAGHRLLEELAVVGRLLLNLPLKFMNCRIALVYLPRHGLYLKPALIPICGLLPKLSLKLSSSPVFLLQLPFEMEFEFML
jgi:hypothetical protein